MFSPRGFGHMLAEHWLGSANLFSDYGRYSNNSRMGDDTCRAIIDAWRSGGGSKFDCSYSYNNIPEILPFVSKKIVSISNFLSRLWILRILSLRWMRSAPPLWTPRV